MPGTAITVFRETLEAALVAGIGMAAGKRGGAAALKTIGGAMSAVRRQGAFRSAARPA